MTRYVLAAALALTVWAGMVPATGAHEFTISLLGGGAAPDAEADLRITDPGPTRTLVETGVRNDTHWAAAVALDAWIPTRAPAFPGSRFDWGLGLDVGYLPLTFGIGTTDQARVDGGLVTTGSRLVTDSGHAWQILAGPRIRVPFRVSSAYPNGRFGPYVGFSAGVEHAEGLGDSDTAFALGGKAGMTVAMTRRVNLLLEGRVSQADHTLADRTFDVLLTQVLLGLQIGF